MVRLKVFFQQKMTKLTHLLLLADMKKVQESLIMLKKHSELKVKICDLPLCQELRRGRERELEMMLNARNEAFEEEEEERRAWEAARR